MKQFLGLTIFRTSEFNETIDLIRESAETDRNIFYQMQEDLAREQSNNVQLHRENRELSESYIKLKETTSNTITEVEKSLEEAKEAIKTSQEAYKRVYEENYKVHQELEEYKALYQAAKNELEELKAKKKASRKKATTTENKQSAAEAI